MAELPSDPRRRPAPPDDGPRRPAKQPRIDQSPARPVMSTADGNTAQENSLNIVRLQVDDKIFYTTRETLLRESRFFQQFLPVKPIGHPADSQYIVIEANPDIFEHILAYLRRGTMPVFWDSVNGFNLALYAAVLVEARHFALPKLAKWIEREEYLGTIKTRTRTELFNGSPADFSEMCNGYKARGYEVEVLSSSSTAPVPGSKVKSAWICPRGINVHDHHPELCGQQCFSRMASRSMWRCPQGPRESPRQTRSVRLGGDLPFKGLAMLV